MKEREKVCACERERERVRERVRESKRENLRTAREIVRINVKFSAFHTFTVQSREEVIKISLSSLQCISVIFIACLWCLLMNTGWIDSCYPKNCYPNNYNNNSNSMIRKNK